ncbi:MAG: 4Fe-4S dicluster domain-containing protein, partial [Planctomycetia bacterium]|nr:4Fe-4S dicluster domain-containing protein [Planctomycetia bacterium]
MEGCEMTAPDTAHTASSSSGTPGGIAPEPPAPGEFVPGAGIDFRNFLECVHCGLCTSSCPTYIELGDENDCPRGRVYLMRAVTQKRVRLSAEIRSHLTRCLDCRSCETACPSGIHYSRLIE